MSTFDLKSILRTVNYPKDKLDLIKKHFRARLDLSEECLDKLSGITPEEIRSNGLHTRNVGIDSRPYFYNIAVYEAHSVLRIGTFIDESGLHEADLLNESDIKDFFIKVADTLPQDRRQEFLLSHEYEILGLKPIINKKYERCKAILELVDEKILSDRILTSELMSSLKGV